MQTFHASLLLSTQPTIALCKLAQTIGFQTVDSNPCSIVLSAGLFSGIPDALGSNGLIYVSAKGIFRHKPVHTHI